MDRNDVDRLPEPSTPVALRKESVDRNLQVHLLFIARMVALRKESVDRNDVDRLPEPSTPCRSPQGERG